MNIQKIKVMVNGLPGNMATNVAQHVLQNERFELIQESLTGPEITALRATIGERKISLIHPDEKNFAISQLRYAQGEFISVDFTQPSAANSNAEFYCIHNLPFVMGTTGGFRKELNETVTASAISAVIAPNMAGPIVGFQAMMEYAATTFPGLFAGYSLEITESHQASKLDTSGTAKALVKCFNGLGIQFSEDQILKERNPEVQRILGVPKQHLGGHGWHTYGLVSPDGSVKLQFTHNVNGRDVYALGVLDAIVFLDKKVKEGVEGKVFSMIDVLKG